MPSVAFSGAHPLQPAGSADMGNLFKKEAKKEDEYIKIIKEYDTENEYINNHATINNALLVKAMKGLIEKVETLEEKKSDKVTYKLPAVNLCSYSLI